MENREQLIDAFMEVFHMFSLKVQETDQSCVELVGTNDISKYDLLLLGVIGKKGEVIMREVAEFLDVPYSTATGIVDKLVQKKIVKRVNSETDRRTVKVALTSKKGQEIFEKFMSCRHKLGEIVLSNMDERDLTDIERIMKKMVRQISDHNMETQLKKELGEMKS
jgi:DNA-binding MarR family transcriptional regulator